MSVVVTGAGGHIGANLVRSLLARGERVRALEFEPSPSLQDLDVERVPGDVRDLPSLKDAFAGADVVYHLAGRVSIEHGDPDGSVRAVNVDGVENAARAALSVGVRRLVHFASCDSFTRRPAGRPIDESRARVPADCPDASAYERTKAEGERRVRAQVASGLDAVIVHPTAVIGPLDFAPSDLGQFFLRLFRRDLPGLVHGGFDFVDVRDVVEGAVAAAERGRGGESYILSGHYATIPELARLSSEVTRVPPPRFTSPTWLAQIGLPLVQLRARFKGTREIFTRQSLANLASGHRVVCGKAERELGYRRRPLGRSVYDLHRWLAEVGLIPRDSELSEPTHRME